MMALAVSKLLFMRAVCVSRHNQKAIELLPQLHQWVMLSRLYFRFAVLRLQGTSHKGCCCPAAVVPSQRL